MASPSTAQFKKTEIAASSNPAPTLTGTPTVGNLLVCFDCTQGTSAFAAGANLWTKQIGGNNAGNARGAIYTRTVQSGDTTTLPQIVTGTVSNKHTLHCWEIQNADVTNGIFSPTQDNGVASSGVATTDSITPPNAWLNTLFLAGMIYEDTTASPAITVGGSWTLKSGAGATAVVASGSAELFPSAKVSQAATFTDADTLTNQRFVSLIVGISGFSPQQNIAGRATVSAIETPTALPASATVQAKETPTALPASATVGAVQTAHLPASATVQAVFVSQLPASATVRAVKTPTALPASATVALVITGDLPASATVAAQRITTLPASASVAVSQHSTLSAVAAVGSMITKTLSAFATVANAIHGTLPGSATVSAKMVPTLPASASVGILGNPPPLPATAVIASTGGLLNWCRRLASLVPAAWFSDSAFNEAPVSQPTNLPLSPVGNAGAIICAIASVVPSYISGLLAYAKLQTRLATKTDGNADGTAQDYFGGLLPRAANENDAPFMSRIAQAVVKAGPTGTAISWLLNMVLGAFRPVSQAVVFDCQDSPERGDGYGLVAENAEFAVEEISVHTPDPLSFAYDFSFYNGQSGGHAVANIFISGDPVAGDLINVTITPSYSSGQPAVTIVYVVQSGDAGDPNHTAASLATAIDASPAGGTILNASTVSGPVIALTTHDSGSDTTNYTLQCFVVSSAAGGAGNVEISGTPATSDLLSVTLSPGPYSGLPPVTVVHVLTSGEAASPTTAAAALASAIEASVAVTGPDAFVASATASGAFVQIALLTSIPTLGVCTLQAFCVGSSVINPTVLTPFSGSGGTAIAPTQLSNFLPGVGGVVSTPFSVYPPVRYFTWALGYGALDYATSSMVQPFGAEEVDERIADATIVALASYAKAAGTKPRYFYNFG